MVTTVWLRKWTPFAIWYSPMTQPNTRPVDNANRLAQDERKGKMYRRHWGKAAGGYPCWKAFSTFICVRPAV